MNAIVFDTIGRSVLKALWQLIVHRRQPDDLFRQIFKSLSKFYVELRIRLEGGKIIPLTRLQMAPHRPNF